MKNVLLFTGQGSQFSGMGAALAAMLPEASAIYEAGSDILGFDLKKMCLEGEDAVLAETCHAQPAIYATELICLEALKARGIACEGVCGHSLGEYAAMTACGMLTAENGFRALKIRAQAMDEAAKSQDSGMYAILRMPAERIGEICAQTPGYVVPVNFNSPAQTVIAGERQAVDAAAKACAAEKARAVPLAVAAATGSGRHCRSLYRHPLCASHRPLLHQSHRRTSGGGHGYGTVLRKALRQPGSLCPGIAEPACRRV